MPEKIKIQKRSVDNLKPTGERYVVWDTEIPGFCVRVGASGSKAYVLKYRVGGGRSGRVRWGVIGMHGALTPDQARDTARQWAAEVASGGDPAGDKMAKRNSITVSDLMGDYLKYHVDVHNKASTATYVKDIVRRIVLKDPIAKLKVADVTEADVSQFLNRLAQTPTTANRVRSAISKAFSLAETWGHRDRNSNPCVGVKKFPEKPRERFLSPLEFAAVGQALALAERGELTVIEGGRLKDAFVSKWAVAAIRLLVFTGARRGEILGLRREWIDEASGRANLPDSKTGRKPLMLPSFVFEILKDLEKPKTGKGYVIRGGDHSDPERPLVNLKDPWSVIRNAAGLPELRIHDLRHSFAYAMVARGASLPIIGALLGHRDVKTTARYAHLATDPLKHAAEDVGRAINTHLGGDAGKKGRPPPAEAAKSLPRRTGP